MKKILLTTLLGILVFPTIAFALPVSWDYSSNILRPLQSMWQKEVQVPWITATSTTATSTFPNASTTNLSISNSLSFGGVTGTTWSDFCTAITGGAGLCDGTDATGGGGGDSAWDVILNNLTPATSTDGIVVNGTSTLATTTATQLTTTGNVGIGTSTPTSLLQIDGGGLYVSDYGSGVAVGGGGTVGMYLRGSDGVSPFGFSAANGGNVSNSAPLFYYSWTAADNLAFSSFNGSTVTNFINFDHSSENVSVGTDFIASATSTLATTTVTSLSVTGVFNFLGTAITNVSTWFNGLFDTQLATKDTGDLTEGSNLYYTEGRVSANTDVAANTSARHDAVTFTGSGTYISLSGQQITVDPITESDISDLGSYLTTVDISDNTNLAVDSPITLTGDTLGFDFSGDNAWTGTGTTTYAGNVDIAGNLIVQGATNLQTVVTASGDLNMGGNDITNVNTINTHTVPAGTGTFALTSDLTGYLDGSTGSVDNILLRSNGTGGTTVQSSGLSISDTNVMRPPSVSGAGNDFSLAGGNSSGSNGDGGDLILAGGDPDGFGSFGAILMKNNLSATGTARWAFSNLTAERSFQFPDEGGTVVINGATQTLTNKTIDGDNNTISNLVIGSEVSGALLNLDDVVVSSPDTGELLVYSVLGDWRNQTLSQAGVQAQDDVLDDLSALSVVADNEFIVGTGAGTYAHESGATARTSLGVAIGSDVQAYDADLTTYAGITPSANVQSLLAAADYAAFVALLESAIESAIDTLGNLIVDVLTYDAAKGTVTALGNIGATETMSFASVTAYTATLDANTTITISGTDTGQRGTISLYYDSSTQRTIAWSGIDSWIGGAPTDGPTDSNPLVVTIWDDGISVIGSWAQTE